MSEQLVDLCRELAAKFREWSRKPAWDIPMDHRTKDTLTSFETTMKACAHVFETEAGRLTAAVAKLKDVPLGKPAEAAAQIRHDVAPASSLFDEEPEPAKPARREKAK